jgi:DNA invertase Pin-like site-specific DNA recombinase
MPGAEEATPGVASPLLNRRLTMSKSKGSTHRDAPTIALLMQNPATYTAATYCRESRLLGTTDGWGMAAQDADAKAFVARYGWQTAPDLHFADGVDENASGSDWDLKGLNAMIDAAQAGRFQVLVVPRNDRFARNMVKALVLEKQLLDAGVQVVYCNMPIDGQGTPEGTMLRNMLHSFAEYDREKIKSKTARGRRRKAEEGKYVGTGPVPYGYVRVLGKLPGVTSDLRQRTLGLAIDERAAAIVRQIFAWACYLPCATIAERLNAAGAPPPNRIGRWNRASVRNLVANPTYYGKALYGRPAGLAFTERRDEANGIAVDVPPINAKALWDQANAASSDRQRKRGPASKSEPDRFELRQLLVCGICGSTLHSWTRTARGDCPPPVYYTCPCTSPTEARDRGRTDVCTLGYVQGKGLHDLVRATVAITLADPARVTAGLARERELYDEQNGRRADRLAIIDGELTTLRRKLKRVIEDKADEERGSESWQIYAEKQREYENLIGKYERERTDLAATPTDGLSADQAAAFRIALAEVAAGLEDLGSAPPAERLDFYRMIGLTGTVTPSANDPQAVTFGRHRYTVELRAKLDLVRQTGTNCSNNFVNSTGLRA